jgi:hypothetical protein
VLADVFMPGKTGYQVCEYVKGQDRLRHIPVMLLVGSFEPFDEAEARRVGADDHLTKPFQSIRELVKKVQSLLNLKPENASAPASESAAAGNAGPASVHPEPLDQRLDQNEIISFPDEPAPGKHPASLSHQEDPVDVYDDLSEVTLARDLSRAQFGYQTLPDIPTHAYDDQPAEALAHAGTTHAQVSEVLPLDLDAPVLDLGEMDRPQYNFAAEEHILDIEYETLPVEIPPVEESPSVDLHEPSLASTAPAEDFDKKDAGPEVVEARVGKIGLDQLSPEAIDGIARRVVEQLSEKVVQQIAWEVVPQLAEIFIKQRLDEEARAKR